MAWRTRGNKCTTKAVYGRGTCCSNNGPFDYNAQAG